VEANGKRKDNGIQKSDDAIAISLDAIIKSVFSQAQD